MKRNDRDRLDLTALEPAPDRERWERMVGGVMRAAAPELARRRVEAASREPGDLLVLLSGWLRPALSAAAALAIAATAALALSPGEPMSEPALGIADGLGVPQPVVAWVETGLAPSLDELLAVVVDEGEGEGE